MTYPLYTITFQSDPKSRTRLQTPEGKSGPIETNGSHTFVLQVNGTSIDVALTHESDFDRTPKLVLTFK